MFNTLDATHAYRGYRLQALYALYRILTSANDPGLVFRPEGEEDLSILDAGDHLLAVNQVKAYSGDLVLSNFKPDRKNSFFYRAAKVLKASPGAIISIVSFGGIGPELDGALRIDGRARQGMARKLSEYGLISEAEAHKLLGGIRIEVLDEAVLTRTVYHQLSASLAGVDPEAAFELLHYWLYICSERKAKITRQDVIERVNRVGHFLHERATYHREWFTAIIPIEDHPLDDLARKDLASEFYIGVSAKYDHILAGLDVIRA